MICFMICYISIIFFFYGYVDHRDLHVLTHSFPTRRSSDLMVGEEVDRGEEGFAAFPVGLDIVDHPLDDEARRIIILGQGRGLAVLGPVRLVVHALDRALFEIFGAAIVEAAGTVVAARVRQPRVVPAQRSDARRVGKECVSQSRYRWS